LGFAFFRHGERIRHGAAAGKREKDKREGTRRQGDRETRRVEIRNGAERKPVAELAAMGGMPIRGLAFPGRACGVRLCANQEVGVSSGGQTFSLKSH
jgi:hypothetical protein